MGRLEHWLGGPPFAVFLKLLVLSLIAGVLMAAFGLSPLGLVRRIVDGLRALYELGFEAFHDLGRYLVTGAMIVLPLWLLSRFMGARR